MGMHMEHIYIALVDTPGIFAVLIRRFLKQKYIHVVLSMDEKLEEAYSFGRRNPQIPFFAGFEREDKNKILQAFPTADYMVCELTCSEGQKDKIRERLRRDYIKRRHYHYAVPGLPFIVCGIPFYCKNQYTCSSYIARILNENHICISKKHFSLVTPRDFYLYPNKKTVFEGSLEEFVRMTEYAAAPEKAAMPGNRNKSGKDGRSMRQRMVAAYGG